MYHMPDLYENGRVKTCVAVCLGVTINLTYVLVKVIGENNTIHGCFFAVGTSIHLLLTIVFEMFLKT